MKTIVEITGQLGSVNAIAGAMSINGLIEVRNLPFYGKAFDYETQEYAVNAMRKAFEELTKGNPDFMVTSDVISEDGTSLYYDAGKAVIYNPQV